MNTHTFLLILHVVAAIAFIGPMLLTPRLLHLMRDAAGRDTLHKLHQQIAVAGWALLAGGLVLLYQQQWAWLQMGWMRLSLALFIGAQAIDHFWADKVEAKVEAKVEQGYAQAGARLGIWLCIKLAVFLIVCALMIAKPALLA
ncbi:hypothetical protein [Janthinobacterium sp. AD80]|uniref:hypothetical protein n=1 Tax=unclassified Janthinobacterium TaxID=2610881 RepID=UPI000C831255|nr:hypothetical protein [Janthinobacterium sp. AD80]PMQ16621.1 hypothetical protein JaAD80_09600 [Janthinobacterium sp. AD80]